MLRAIIRVLIGVAIGTAFLWISACFFLRQPVVGKLHDRPPESRVQLVAFANEEPPFFGSHDMGSAVHAESLQASRSKVRMICLEMIGYFHGEQYLRNPNDHTMRDTAGTLDCAPMARVIDGVYNAALWLTARTHP